MKKSFAACLFTDQVDHDHAQQKDCRDDPGVL